MSDLFVHPQALCESKKVGNRTRIWAFAHILPGAELGEDCNICDNVFIENDVLVGDRVTIKCGVQLWDGLVIEDDVFIGPNATFTNDPFPRSQVKPATFAKTIVRSGATIGANATILPGIEIGQGAMVGAGAVVTRSVPPNAIVAGNPASITGYIPLRSDNPVSGPGAAYPTANERQMLGIGGTFLQHLRTASDLRGELSVAEFESELPFVPKRFFVVYSVPTPKVRGEHAHRSCHQFLLCVHGSCRVLLDDGSARRDIVLDRPGLGVYVPPLIWSVQYEYSSDGTLLAFASHAYDPADYIRTYPEFLSSLRA